MTGIRLHIIRIALVAFLVPFLLPAQDSLFIKGLSPNQLKAYGKNSLKQFDYGAAVYSFERFVKLRPQHAKGAYWLGESYRYSRDYQKAQEWYYKAYEKSGKKNMEALYNSALMLKMTGDYTKSRERFNEVLKVSKGNSKYKDLKKSIKTELSGCDSAVKMLQYPKSVAILHLDTTINKVHVEHSPFALNDSTIIYTSLRTDKREFITDTDTANWPVKKIYAAKKENGKWTFSGEYEGPFNQPGMNISNGSFSPDGKRLYFTRCKLNWQNKMICAIYVSQMEKGSWTEPVALDKRINNPKYTSTMPAIGVESKKGNDVVYFVSDRPKGKGKLDVWYTIYDLKRKIYSTPRNAGTKINTTSDELTPFYDLETHSLYFSSSGWQGMGGMDVFRSRGELNKFLPSENVGAPVNSSTDDIYYAESKNREEGFIISNRKGGVGLKGSTCCDDMYSFKRLEYIHLSLVGNIYEGRENFKMDKPIGEATVSIYINDSRSPEPVFIKTVTTTNGGNYNVKLEAGTDYKVIASKEGYLNTQVGLSTKSETSSREIRKDLGLDPLPNGSIVLKNIYYDFDKSELSQKSTVTIDTTLMDLLMENPDIIIEISSHTDSKGTEKYNQTLSQKRAESVVNYLIGKGIAKERLSAMGYGETKPLVPNTNPDGSDNPAGREKNRRTEFRIIGKLKDESIEKIEYKE